MSVLATRVSAAPHAPEPIPAVRGGWAPNGVASISSRIMTRSIHRSLALVLAAGTLLAACGSTGTTPPPAGTTGTATTTTTSGPPPVTHADPVSLVPAASEVQRLIKPLTSPGRYDQRLNPSTLGSAFSSAVPRAARLASGAAELDAVGRNGASLYIDVFEFKRLGAAQSLAATFLSSTRLGTVHVRPSGSPGEQGQASSQPYGNHHGVSYRYAFREQNVLVYVELDGRRGRYALADAVRVATLVERRIKAALS